MNIGSLVVDPPVLLAPLAGISNLPFRVLNRRYGCALAFTEMISATGLVRNMRKTFRYLETAPEDRPLGVQLFGTDPGVLAAAAEIAAARGADLIDLNMGCPVRKVVRTGAGAALMKNPALAFEIMKAVRRSTALPLTVKLRSGWSDRAVNAPELARLAAEAGLDAVIVHPRTVSQGFGGRADWRIIAEVKRALAIPGVGNGDIRTPADAVRMRAETGCDGVMVGRGALGNPWIFQGIASAGGGREAGRPDPAERNRVIRRHWAAEAAYAGPAVAVRTFRKHLLWYTKGLKGGAVFRQTAGRLTDEAALFAELDRFFSTLAPGDGDQAIKA